MESLADKAPLLLTYKIQSKMEFGGLHEGGNSIVGGQHSEGPLLGAHQQNTQKQCRAPNALPMGCLGAPTSSLGEGGHQVIKWTFSWIHQGN